MLPQSKVTEVWSPPRPQQSYRLGLGGLVSESHLELILTDELYNCSEEPWGRYLHVRTVTNPCVIKK